MKKHLLSICLLTVFGCVGAAVASSPETDQAQALIDEYSKPAVIRIVIDHCADAHVTISDSEGFRQVLGRPSQHLVNAETIAHDIQRCGGNIQALAQELRRERRTQQDQLADSRKDAERFDNSPRIQALRLEASGLVAEAERINHQYNLTRENSLAGQAISRQEAETLRRLHERKGYINQRIREIAAEAHALRRLNYLGE